MNAINAKLILTIMTIASIPTWGLDPVQKCKDNSTACGTITGGAVIGGVTLSAAGNKAVQSTAGAQNLPVSENHALIGRTVEEARALPDTAADFRRIESHGRQVSRRDYSRVTLVSPGNRRDSTNDSRLTAMRDEYAAQQNDYNNKMLNLQHDRDALQHLISDLEEERAKPQQAGELSLSQAHRDAYQRWYSYRLHEIEKARAAAGNISPANLALIESLNELDEKNSSSLAAYENQQAEVQSLKDKLVKAKGKRRATLQAQIAAAEEKLKGMHIEVQTKTSSGMIHFDTFTDPDEARMIVELFQKQHQEIRNKFTDSKVLAMEKALRDERLAYRNGTKSIAEIPTNLRVSEDHLVNITSAEIEAIARNQAPLMRATEEAELAKQIALREERIKAATAHIATEEADLARLNARLAARLREIEDLAFRGGHAVTKTIETEFSPADSAEEIKAKREAFLAAVQEAERTGYRVTGFSNTPNGAGGRRANMLASAGRGTRIVGGTLAGAGATVGVMILGTYLYQNYAVGDVTQTMAQSNPAAKIERTAPSSFSASGKGADGN